MTTAERIYSVVAQIPRGCVVTYGDIAKKAGIKSPRFVGTVLHKNSDPSRVPCHRVVNARGCVAKHYAFGGAGAQKKKLQQEGVLFVGDRVAL